MLNTKRQCFLLPIAMSYILTAQNLSDQQRYVHYTVPSHDKSAPSPPEFLAR